MAVTTYTRPQLRALLYRMVPGLGVAGTADSIDGSGIHDAFTLQDSNKGATKWRGSYLYRPNRTGTDRIQKAGTLSGSALQNTGAAYSNTSDLAYEIVGLVHPDELNECIRRANQKVLFESQLCYSQFTDGDMAATTAATWNTQDSHATSSKDTTTLDTGFQSLKVAADSSSNPHYTETPPLSVEPNSVIYTATNCKTDLPTTTLQFRLWDKTNNVEIGSPMSHSLQSWQHLHRWDVIPSNCQSIAVRLQVNQASANAWFDCLPSHDINAYRIAVEGLLDEKYKLVSFGEAIYRFSSIANGQVSQGQETSRSRQWAHWVQPRDFALESFRPEGSPYHLIINKKEELTATSGSHRRSSDTGLPRNDLWFHIRRPYADMGDLIDETTTTSGPEFELLEASMYELALICKDRYPDEPRWQRWVVEKAAAAEAEKEARPVTPEVRKPRNYGGRI